MLLSASTYALHARNPAYAALRRENAEDLVQESKFDPTKVRRVAMNTSWAHAPVAEMGVHASLAALDRLALPGVATDIEIEDWNVLLCAVKTRLRLTVGERLAAQPETSGQDNAGGVRASVLECVEALDQLHATHQHEVGRRQRLELEVFDARSALAQVRAELVGTRAQETRARHLARHDSLTSLPNRSLFRERLDRALAPAELQRQAFAVLYIDLDGFKPINDTYGHATGDELLRIVAARLNQAVRAEDMVSRLGGDEFACLLSELPNREQLSHLACKLFDAVSAPVKIGRLTITVRPSIGIGMFPGDGATAEALLKNADAAMYRAKRQQTGYAFFDERADTWAHEADELANS